MDDQGVSQFEALTRTLNQSGAEMDKAPEGERGNSPATTGNRQDIHSPPPALPINWGSQQWRLMRRALRVGATIEQAAEAGDMSVFEARALAKIDADRAPLPPEAFQLLKPVALATQPEKETVMAKNEDPESGEGGGIYGEYHRPDAQAAIQRYKDAIAPKKTHISTLTGDLSEHYKFIKDDCHFPRKVLDFLMQLDDMEGAKRDHFLLAFNMGLKELNLFLPSDLVTMAQGEDGGNVIPMGQRQDATEDLSADLEGASSTDIFEEASEEELAKQEGRGEPKPGTGAAARKKMKDSAPAEASALH